MKVSFGNIQNDYDSYNKLINFYHKSKNEWETIEIQLGWFSANSCSMLGALLALLQNNFRDVEINAGNATTILEKNGFLSFFGHKKLFDSYSTTIPYKVLSPEDDRYFNEYVFNDFLGKSDLPDMSLRLKKKIAESIYEIFINSKMHSKTTRIFTCGQFFPQKETIEFMITDLGTGIRDNINKRFGANINSIDAIKWAMINGNTTKKCVSGGIGLAILEEFIRKNNGKIQIISNNGFWELNKNETNSRFFDNEFPGTAINISVNTNDTSHYYLYEEVNDIF